MKLNYWYVLREDYIASNTFIHWSVCCQNVFIIAYTRWNVYVSCLRQIQISTFVFGDDKKSKQFSENP